jgi:hypothetical protein
MNDRDNRYPEVPRPQESAEFRVGQREVVGAVSSPMAATTMPRSAVKGGAVPLSESEQRILSDLEASFSKQDPWFVRSVRRSRLFLNARHSGHWAIAGFIVGLAILVLFLTQSIALSLFGVFLMLLSSVVIARNAELKGRATANNKHRIGE